MMAAPWSDVLTLLEAGGGIDDDGFAITEPHSPVDVYANRKSIRSTEYYAAKQAGIELSYMFEVRSMEYDGQDIVDHEGERFEVERTYEKGEFIELVLRKRADDHD